MKLSMYGYCINSVVQYRVSDSFLFNIENKKCIHLRKTMARLLHFLLMSAKEGIITDNDILHHVWEKHNLQASGARLWQVMQSLRKKFEEVGLENNFIFRVEGRGYVVLERHVVPLYCEDGAPFYLFDAGEDENPGKTRSDKVTNL